MTFRHPLALPLLALAACAGQEATRTGFLALGYDKLQPTKEHPGDLIDVSPAYGPANYTKAVIEPVAWRPADGAPQRDASVEIEVLDAGSGQTMVALATFNNGMPWNVLGYYQRLGHARRAFDKASELLVEQLAQRQK